MESSVLYKHRGLLKRESAHEGKHSKILEVRHANIIFTGLYASFSASAHEWMDIDDLLKCLVPNENH